MAWSKLGRCLIETGGAFKLTSFKAEQLEDCLSDLHFEMDVFTSKTIWGNLFFYEVKLFGEKLSEVREGASAQWSSNR